jgi:hypothetical protein
MVMGIDGRSPAITVMASITVIRMAFLGVVMAAARVVGAVVVRLDDVATDA